MLTLQLLINGVATGLMAAPVAMGFSLILGIQRFWHLAHGAVFVWTCYGAYELMRVAPLWLALILAPALAGLLGCALDQLVYRGLRWRQTNGLMMFVAALGVYGIGANLAALVYGFDSKVANGESFNSLAINGSLTVSWLQVAMAVCGILSFAFLFLLLKGNGVGLEIRAMLADTEMAEIVGVRPQRLFLVSMGVGSALLGLPAVLTTVSVGADPNVGLNLVLIAAIGSILGGLGSPLGAFAGALVLGIASTIPLAYVGTEWQQAIAFGILIVVILVKPTGFFGRTIWKARV